MGANWKVHPNYQLFNISCLKPASIILYFTPFILVISVIQFSVSDLLEPFTSFSSLVLTSSGSKISKGSPCLLSPSCPLGCKTMWSSSLRIGVGRGRSAATRGPRRGEEGRELGGVEGREQGGVEAADMAGWEMNFAAINRHADRSKRRPKGIFPVRARGGVCCLACRPELYPCEIRG